MERKLLTKVVLILALIGACVYFAFPLQKRINLGLDLRGGMHLLLKVDTTKLPEKDKADACDRALEVIRNRIDQFGVRESSIQKQGEDEIVVQLPGVSDRERARELIGRTALLEFKIVSNDADKMKAALEGNVPEGFEVQYTQDDRAPLLLEKAALMTGSAITNAMVRFDSTGIGSEPIVAIEFSPEGAKKFAEVTAANVGRRLAIVLDGKVQSAPNIKEAIPSGQAVITGRFDYNQANDLALVLRVGALPAPMYVEEERTVGPLLGQDSINSGIKASLIGIVFVFLFMVAYYLLAGVVANVALILNLLMILGGLGMLPMVFPGVSATLTLPGIAGIVLSLGMAVDANVLINERIREEKATGKTLRQSISNGYSRAFSAILDSNVTTLIAAFLLFQFGTGPIRGFAVTLTIGLIASMFTAIVVTRTVFEVLLHFNLLKSLPMVQMLKTPKIDYISKRWICYILSLVVTIGGLTVFFMKGEKAYGIDFSGGQLQEYSSKEPLPIDEVRGVLKDLGLGEATIQQFKENPKLMLIRSTEDKSTELTTALEKRFPGSDIQVLRIEHVGPVAGKHLKDKAIWATVWSMVGILIYIFIRFKHIEFAIAGIIALLHDVLVALGALAITGRQIDLLSVTAFLTIAGFSINDTIVIYDRVRENMRLNRKLSLRDLINLSVNQCLSRTIITTGVTLLTVVAIYAWGGEVLNNFAFALLVGFFCGAYSTVFIASPLVLAWSKRGTK